MVSSTANITLKLNIDGGEEWAGVVTTVNELKTALASLGKSASSKLALIDQVKKFDVALKAANTTIAQQGTKITALEASLKNLGTQETIAGKNAGTTNTALKNLGVTLDKDGKLVQQMGASFGGESKKVVTGIKSITTAQQAADKEYAAAQKALSAQFAVLDKYDAQLAKVAKQEEQAALKAKKYSDAEAAAAKKKADAIAAGAAKEAAAFQKDVAAEENNRKVLAGLIASMNAVQKASPTWWKSNQATGIRAVSNEMKALQASLTKTAVEAVKTGKALDPGKLKQFQNAVAGASSTTKQWGESMKGLAGRLTFFEQQMDAILRASYRFKAVGSDLTRFANNIFNGFKSVMTVFGQFDFNIRRAAGSVQLFEGVTIDGADGLGLLSKKALDVAEAIKFIPVADVAKGFYFWGSMTGTVVDSMTDLNTLVEGHTAVLKAASMTEVGFEAALKGVYSVLTQFYGGDLAKTVDVTEKLFYTAQTTAAEFGDLIQSFKMVGPVAHGLGATFEDILNLIGQLSNFGIRGSMAGRAVRQIFIQLIKPSAIAKTALEATFQATKDGFADLKQYGSYYEAIFPNGQYVGVKRQITVLAEMTQNMTTDQRGNLLALMSTANSLPVLVALVGKKVRELHVGINNDMKSSFEQAHEYFTKNWKLLSDSWLGVVGGLQRAWEALKVGIGTGVASFAKPIVEFIQKVVDGLRQWAEENPKVVAGISKFLAMVAVLAAIGGALFTITGTLLALGGASYVFVRSFMPLKEIAKGAQVALEGAGEAASGVAQSVDEIKTSFLDMSKVGLKAFVGVIALLVGLMEAVSRNAQYIQTRLDDALKTLTAAGSSAGDTFRLLGDLIGKVQEGVNFVFDLLVRRLADAIDAFAHLIDFMGQLGHYLTTIQGLGSGFQAMGKVVGVVAQAIGVLIGASMLNKLISFIPVLGAINTKFMEAAEGALGLAGAEGVLASATRALVGATGIGLLVVGISLLVDWFGKANQSLADMKSQTETTAAGFGTLASEAKTAAESIATSYALIERSQAAALSNTKEYRPQKSDPLLALLGDVDAQKRQRLAALNTMNTDYVAFEKEVQALADEQLTKWKGMVDSINFQWINSGKDFHIDYEGFVAALMKVDRSGLKETVDQKQKEFIAEYVAAVAPDASRAEISQLYKDMVERSAAAIGEDVGVSLSDFSGMVYNAAAHSLTVQKDEGAKWGELIKSAMGIAGIGSASTVSDVNKFLDGQITMIVRDGLIPHIEHMTIREALGGKEIPDEVLQPLFQSLMQGVDDSIARIADNPQAIVSKSIDDLATGFTDLLKFYVNSGFEAAVPGIREIMDNLNDTIGQNLGGTFDPNAMFASIFETAVSGFDGQTVEQMLTSGTTAIPESLRKAFTDWLTTLSEQGVVAAGDLLKAMKPAAANQGDEAGKAFADFLKSVRGNFIDTVTSGIKKSFKDLTKELRNRLNNPAKFGDAASLRRLIAEAADPTILFAMHQDTDTVAKQKAMDWFTNTFVLPTIGGIQAALDNGDTATANRSIKGFIKDLTKVDPDYWKNLDPTIAQNVKDWLTSNNITIPPSILNGLTASINAAQTGVVDGIKPLELKPSDLFSFGGTGNDESGKNPAVKGGAVNPIIKNIMPTAADSQALQTQITTQTTSAVNGAANALGPVASTAGQAVIQKFATGMSSLANLLNNTVMLLAATAVSHLDDYTDKAYAGGLAIGNAWKRGLDAALSDAQTMLNHKLLFFERKLGGSLPKDPPLNHPQTGGKSIGDAWGNALARAVEDTKPKVDKHLQSLRKALAGAKSWMQHLKGLNRPDDSGYFEREIRRQEAVIRRAQAALDRYLHRSPPDGKDGGKDNGNGKRPKEADSTNHNVGDKAKHNADNTKKQLAAAINSIKASLVNYQQRMIAYRKQINDLMKGGLTAEEKNRKTYIEQLIGDLQFRSARANAKLKKLMGELAHAPNDPRKNHDPAVGDTRGNATVTDVSKRIIEIHIDVESKDGSVDKANQRQIRKGVTDALMLADLQHMVTVH